MEFPLGFERSSPMEVLFNPNRLATTGVMQFVLNDRLRARLTVDLLCTLLP
jgi:hypothetical protein